MGRRKKDKQYDNNGFEQLSLFNILEIGDNNDDIKIEVKGSEQSNIHNIENEQTIGNNNSTISKRSRDQIQSDNKGTSNGNASIQSTISPNGKRSSITSDNSETYDRGMAITTTVVQSYESQKFSLDRNTDQRLTLREKIIRNINAIQLLKTITREDRFASTEEKEILSKFSGWGGCPQLFNDQDTKFSSERKSLKDILSLDEYKNARASTLTSFYTPYQVIENIYKIIDRLGFKNGVILDPSLGTGNFLGMMPEDMFNDSAIYGIELDNISGTIATTLYPEIETNIMGFENTLYPDNQFDLIVSNVPFGKYKLHDKELNKYGFDIHNYFFAKSLQKLRNGGIVAFITSTETMDGNNKVMDYINDRADFLGAIRLPSNTFMQNGANTVVASDIIFIQKNEGKIVDRNINILEKIQCTVHKKMNKYFIDNPSMIFGTVSEKKNQYGNYDLVIEDNHIELDERFNSIINTFKNTYEDRIEDIKNNRMDVYDMDVAHSKLLNNSFFVEKNKLFYKEIDRYYAVKLTEDVIEDEIDSDYITFKSEKDINKVIQLINLSEIAQDVINAQVNELDESIYINKRDELNERYDTFVKQFGALNKRTNLPLISDDPKSFLLHSLETYDAKNKTINKASIFYERTIKVKKEIKNVSNIYDALMLSLDNKGTVDLEYMAMLYEKEETVVKEELINAQLVFLEPYTFKMILADEYLSGNVRKKLEFAEEVGFEKNIKALTSVMPEDIAAEEIKIQLGSPWIPEKYIVQFVNQLFKHNPWDRNYMNISYEKLIGSYVVSTPSFGNDEVKKVWGVMSSKDVPISKRQPIYTGYDLLSDVLNSRIPTIFNYWDEWDDERGKNVLKREVNIERTTLARDLAESLNETWEDWIYEDIDRKKDIVMIYNEKFNSVRVPSYDGSYLSFSNMNASITLEDYQKNTIARIMKSNNTLLSQVVGAGKTFEMIASGMEMKRLGIRNKLLYVVPNHLLAQWGNEFVTLYPQAKILVATKKDFAKKNRKVLINKIATENYDAIILAHSSFGLIGMDIEYQISHMNKEIDQLNFAIEEINNADKSNLGSKRIKVLERTKKSIEKNIKNLTDTKRDEDNITFDQLGIDYMYVDESHEFKNLYNYTAMQNVAGLQTQHSAKASDMFMKVKYIEKHGGNVCFATGTPITNTMAELYTLQRYLQEEDLKDMGIYSFDGWAKCFGKVVNSFEISVDGNSFVNKPRFCKFFNIQELMTTFRMTAEILTGSMLKKALETSNNRREKAIPPKRIGDKPKIVTIEPSEELEDYISNVVERTEAIHDRMVNPHDDNMLKVTTDSKKASIDLRLIDEYYGSAASDKLNQVAIEVFHIYKEYGDDRATQLIFCDSSTPSKYKFNVYDEIKYTLIELGVKEEEIAFIHDYNSEKAKEELFKNVNTGKIRILLGSTAKLGAGTNVQERLIAIHHVDVPWRASDIEQRNGRGFRQGNMFNEIYEVRYVTKKSFDAYSWQMIETKSTYMSQLLEGNTATREIEEDVQATFSYAEVKAIASGNPYIKEKFEVDNEIRRLEQLKQQFKKKKLISQDEFNSIPSKIEIKKNVVMRLNKEWNMLSKHIYQENEIDNKFSCNIRNKDFRSMKEANELIWKIVEKEGSKTNEIILGTFCGCEFSLNYDKDTDNFSKWRMYLKTDENDVIKSEFLNAIGRVSFVRLLKSCLGVKEVLKENIITVKNLEDNLVTAEELMNSTFAHETTLKDLKERQQFLNKQLSSSKNDNLIIENNDLEELDFA